MNRKSFITMFAWLALTQAICATIASSQVSYVEQASREQASREQASREQASRERASREQVGLSNRIPNESDFGPLRNQTCLVVCPPRFRLVMEPWREHRENQGIKVLWSESGANASTVRDSLKRAFAADSNGIATPSWILLVGDCQVADAENCDPLGEVPTFYRNAGPSAKYGTTPTLAGDAPYGDWNDDGIPEISVGRLPVDRPEDLQGIVQKIVAYERSDDVGLWRDAVQITAGVGGFGFLIDKAIESATRSVLVASLPAAVRLAVTYASPSSPFNPGADHFFPTVLRRYHEGSLFWVYMGHGQVTELDKVPGPNGTRRPVLSGDDVGLLQQKAGKTPIAVLLACYSGAYDASVDCLAERMLVAPGGPIAVLAGSRVTMPYGNAIAAQGLMHAVYHHRVPRLGDAWLRAQRELATEQADDADLVGRRGMVDILAKAFGGDSASLKAERLEHIHLYNLLGDPTLTLRYPEAIDLTVPKSVKWGESIEIFGSVAHGGTLDVSVCYPPGGVPDDMRLESVQRYERAHCIELSQARVEQEGGGDFRITLEVPEGVQGKLRIIARVQGNGVWSNGNASVIVLPRSYP